MKNAAKKTSKKANKEEKKPKVTAKTSATKPTKIESKKSSKSGVKSEAAVAEPIAKSTVTKSPKTKVSLEKTEATTAPERATPKMMSGLPLSDSETKGKKAPKASPVTDADKSDPEWVQLANQNKGVKPVPYVMSDDYHPKAVINHKILGLGFVLKSQNNRIEVQFKDGKKMLITNYKKT